MSQHADITKEVLARSVKFNLSLDDAHDLLTSILVCADYDDSMLPSKSEMASLVRGYLLNQRDGLYGVSHDQINDWLSRNGTLI